MKSYKFFLILLLLLSSQILFAQRHRNDYRDNYIGIGTALSTFAGGDLGSTFQLKFLPYYDDGYYDYHYYNYNYYYDDYHRYRDRFEGICPLEISLFGGHHFNDHLTIELESSFIWHPVGSPDRNYYSGDNYVDFNDDPTLIAVPIMASVKYFPFNRFRSPFYLSAGAGVQFTYETMDRVRSHYNSYDDYLYKETLSSYTSQHWYPGVKVALGTDFHLHENMHLNMELKYQNFFNTDTHPSPLVINSTDNIGYVALAMKIYFSF